MNEEMTQDIIEAEVWDAIKTLQGGKTPGIGGLPILQIDVSLFKSLITTMCNRAFHSRRFFLFTTAFEDRGCFDM